MALRWSTIIASLLLAACGRKDAEPPSPRESRAPEAPVETTPTPSARTLLEARRGFTTRLVSTGDRDGPPDAPPADGAFVLVSVEAPPGKLPAYVTRDPGDGQRHPAIVWLHGGDTNGIDGFLWGEMPPDNEQTASAYRKAGIVMMYPSLRGGNDNPGRREGFLGEVDDVLAAADHLAALPYVDPQRIYLGGHSTGGTLAVLVAEISDRFRAVVAFGPVDDVAGYGGDFVYCDPNDEQEIALRSPIHWLSGIRSPVFVFEGTDDGNADSLRAMARASSNPQLQLFEIGGTDHFGILGPVNAVIASKIMNDAGATPNLGFDLGELQRLFGR